MDTNHLNATIDDVINVWDDYSGTEDYFSYLPIGNRIESNEELDRRVDEFYKNKHFNIKAMRWGILGNILSMILNGIVGGVLSSCEDLKTIHLFPVLLQCGIDFIFTGLVPLFGNVISLSVLQRNALYNWLMNHVFFNELNIYTCRVFTVCDGVTLASTGPIICAVAFVRFIGVCHPFRVLGMEQSGFFKKLMFGLVLLILAAIFCQIFSEFYFFGTCPYSPRSIDSHFSDFELNPLHFSGKVLIFFIPAFAVSTVFYYKISKELLKKERNIGRNRGLTLAFSINTFLWACLWTMAFVAKVPLQSFVLKFEI